MAPTKIVALETFFCPLPDFSSLPFEVSLEAYSRSTPEDIPGRIVDASIIIVTTLRLARAVLARDVCPHLRLIVVMASGTNNIDIEACKDRNIQVKNCPGANTDAVAQHALALFLACRRKLVQLHHATLGTNGESANGKGAKSPWEAEGTLMSRLLDRHGKAPVGLGDEVVGIIGFGRVGKTISDICSALGMTVLVSARKNQPGSGGHDNRHDFDHVLRNSTVVMVCLPLESSTFNSISAPEFQLMRPDAVLVNVSRGGVVNEKDLLTALHQGAIYGAATDVFSEEPAGFSNALLAGRSHESVNLIVSPHLAWLTQPTITRLQHMALANIRAWLLGGDVGNFSRIV